MRPAAIYSYLFHHLQPLFENSSFIDNVAAYGSTLVSDILDPSAVTRPLCEGALCRNEPKICEKCVNDAEGRGFASSIEHIKTSTEKVSNRIFTEGITRFGGITGLVRIFYGEMLIIPCI